jgi:hypothetical protein
MDAGGADGVDMPVGAPTAKPGWETRTSRNARLAAPASAHAKVVRQRITTSLAEMPGVRFRRVMTMMTTRSGTVAMLHRLRGAHDPAEDAIAYRKSVPIEKSLGGISRFQKDPKHQDLLTTVTV